MTAYLVRVITADDPALRDQPVDAFCREAPLSILLEECAALERFRLEAANLYHRVRASFFLYAVYRFHLPDKTGVPRLGPLPYEGYLYLLERRFEESLSLIHI